MTKIKLFGVIGSAVLCFGYLPAFTIYLSIIGYVFIGISLHMLSKVKKGSFFENFLIASVLSVVSTFLFYFKIFAIITSIVISVLSNNPIVPLTLSIFVYFFIYFILMLLSSYFFFKSFYEIYTLFNNEFFRYAGLLLVLGAVLTIFGIGFLVQIIGWLLLLLGFLTLNDIIEVEIIQEKIEEKN